MAEDTPHLDQFPDFSFDHTWLNSPNETQQTPRFPSLSDQELDKIVSERHSKKTKQTTNWSVSTFKGM